MMNKKEQLQIGVTAVLSIVLFFLVIQGVARKQAKQPEVMAKLATARPAENASSGKNKQKELFLKLAEETKNAELKRDPFFPIPKVVPRELLLNGIVWDTENPVAIINNIVVKAGDDIEGNTVVDIQENSVTLTNGSRTLTLELKLQQ